MIGIYSYHTDALIPEITKDISNKYKISETFATNYLEMAGLTIYSTQDVVGCTGGLGKKTTARSLNRATQSIRQTGSAIKPIAVLAPAINKKIITASSVFDDTPRDFGNGYQPTDYSKSLGKITVRRAVESSQNVPFVEIMQKLKPSNSIRYLEKMGITTLTKKDNGLPLSLRRFTTRNQHFGNGRSI